MSPQLTPTRRLPALSSPELDRLRSRLESGLLRLAQLTSTEADTTEFPVVACKEDWGMVRSKVPVERRAFPRRAGHCRVTVCRLSEEDAFHTLQQIEWRLHGASLKGNLADLSLNGAGVILPHGLPVGEKVVLRLHCPRRDMHLDQQAHVVGTLPANSGESKVLCQFTARLSLDQAAYFRRFI